MKLVTFGIDRDSNLIIQFPVFVQPYTQQLLILYQIETLPVPIVDQNKQANSYTHVQITRPYNALNSETHISIRHQEPRMCRRFHYEFYCEEPFRVKHTTKYSCGSAIYFDLGPDIIKGNCNFAYFVNKVDITPTVLDGGNEIILANWPDDKHIICNVNNDIPVKISSYPCVLVNRSVFCISELEAENNFLLESLATYHNANSELTMYYTVNKALVNYLDSLDNLTDTLAFPALHNRTTHKERLPISLQSFAFDKGLFKAPKMLKDLVHQLEHRFF